MKILLIALVWPEPTSSAAGTRTVSLLRYLSSASNEVHVWSPCQHNPFRELLETLGVRTKQVMPNDSSVDEALKALAPDVVIFDRFMIEEMFGWRVKQCCPDAALILDTIDLHFLRKARQGRYESNRSATLADLNISKDLSLEEFFTDEAFREIASIYRCDLSLVVSDFEYQLLIEKFEIPEDRLLLLPIGAQRNTSNIPFEVKEGFCSIGNFNHPPNKESVLLLKNVLWPRIRKELIESVGIQDPTISIYGSYPSSDIQALDSPKAGFLVKGWVPDAIEAMQKHRVSLSPLLFGAGIKGKILDSWSAGTPVVTTAIGAEGMTFDGAFGGLISDSVDDFVRDAVRLYSDKHLFESALSVAELIRAKRFNHSSISDLFVISVGKLLEDLPQRRKSSFISRMLDFHQFRSTEFMSRWIEIKNK